MSQWRFCQVFHPIFFDPEFTGVLPVFWRSVRWVLYCPPRIHNKSKHSFFFGVPENTCQGACQYSPLLRHAMCKMNGAFCVHLTTLMHMKKITLDSGNCNAGVDLRCPTLASSGGGGGDRIYKCTKKKTFFFGVDKFEYRTTYSYLACRGWKVIFFLSNTRKKRGEKGSAHTPSVKRTKQRFQRCSQITQASFLERQSGFFFSLFFVPFF